MAGNFAPISNAILAKLSQEAERDLLGSREREESERESERVRGSERALAVNNHISKTRFN